mmetsp:Transcript_94754/g.267506  ORF Transcript_94754/g.267506 Transcript_94754/m.267506 type:complete len:204 (-) Transcript_94754:350-961(-)
MNAVVSLVPRAACFWLRTQPKHRGDERRPALAWEWCALMPKTCLSCCAMSARVLQLAPRSVSRKPPSFAEDSDTTTPAARRGSTSVFGSIAAKPCHWQPCHARRRAAVRSAAEVHSRWVTCNCFVRGVPSHTVPPRPRRGCISKAASARRRGPARAQWLRRRTRARAPPPRYMGRKPSCRAGRRIRTTGRRGRRCDVAAGAQG